MKIYDYETSRELSDIGISLSRAEIEELHAYLDKLLALPALKAVHLSDFEGTNLEREVTLTVDHCEEAGSRRSWKPRNCQPMLVG